MEFLWTCIGCVALCVVIVIILSIKDRENIFKNIGEFFAEWWSYIKNYGIYAIIILVIIAILSWAVFG